MRREVTGRIDSAGEVCGQGTVSSPLRVLRDGLVLLRLDRLSLAKALFPMRRNLSPRCDCHMFAHVLGTGNRRAKRA
jgi:hypothetical protein